MATYQKRGNAWRVQVRLRGNAISATFDTHEEARAWASAQEAKLLARAKVKDGQAAFLTPADLFRRYAMEVCPSRRGERWEVIRLAMLERFPVFDRPMRDFGPEDLAAWRDDRLKAVAASSVNRELNLISGVFSHAIREWRVGLRENPVHLISRPPNPAGRSRRVSDAEALAIRAQLGWDGVSPPASSSQWVAWAHALAIETAMRKGEILGLSRSRVHLPAAYVELLAGAVKGGEGQTKTGRGRNVPLSARARELLALAGGGDPDVRVVPVTPGTCDTLFRRAVQAAGIRNLHFHDSRREATTRIAPKVGNALDLAKITGHRDPRQLMGYYEPDATELAKKLG
jgi:integrase